MGIQINGQTDTISATDGSFTISGASGNLTGNLTGDVTGNVTGNLTGTASTATAAATAYGLSGSPTLSGITSVSTTNLTVNGNTYPSAGPLSNRNIIINGAMQVAQRGTGPVTAVDNSNEGYLTVDRFDQRTTSGWGSTRTLSVQQSSSAPTGFSNSYHINVNATDATDAGLSYIRHRIEGQDIVNSGWDQTDPNSELTLSFYVRADHTATYCVTVLSDDTANHSFVHEYTIAAANTWQRVSFQIPGVSSLTIGNDNGNGFEIRWMLGVASSINLAPTADVWNTSTFGHATSNQDNFYDTLGNDLWITGIQLEVGSVATPFEHRSYGDQLAKCQRYFQQLSNCELVGSKNTLTRMRISGKLITEMRIPPTVTRTSTSLGFQDVGATQTSTNTTAAQATTQGVRYMAFDIAGFSNLADRSYGGADSHGNGAVFNCDAEL